MKKLLKNNRLRIYLFLGVIVLSGAFLRFYNLGDNSFVADEFLDINATYGYHQTGNHQSWDFNANDVAKRQNAPSDERAWIYREQVAFLYNFLPPTELTARSISALWGVLGILIIYFVTFSFTRNRTIALLAAFLLAVSVPVLEVDRKIRLYAMFGPIFLLFSWALFQFLGVSRSRLNGTLIKNIFTFNYLYLIPTLVLGALAFHLHPLTAAIVFVLFVYFCWGVLQYALTQKVIAMRYGIYALSILVVVIGIKFLLPERWAWFMSTLKFFEDHWTYGEHILRNYWHPLIGVLLMIAGGWWLTAANHTEEQKGRVRGAGVWIVCNFVVILCASIFLWKRNVGAQYIFFIQSFGLILASAGIYMIISWIKNLSSARTSFLVVIALAVLLVPNYAYFLQRNNTYHLKSDADTPNYREVFTFVKKDFDAGDALITRNFRSYYFSGLNAIVYDFGSERDSATLKEEGKVKKMTLVRALEIIDAHESGWIVYSDNDEEHIEKELQKYLEEGSDERIKRIDHVNIRGKINVYRWK